MPDRSPSPGRDQVLRATHLAAKLTTITGRALARGLAVDHPTAQAILTSLQQHGIVGRSHTLAHDVYVTADTLPAALAAVSAGQRFRRPARRTVSSSPLAMATGRDDIDPAAAPDSAAAPSGSPAALGGLLSPDPAPPSIRAATVHPVPDRVDAVSRAVAELTKQVTQRHREPLPDNVAADAVRAALSDAHDLFRRNLADAVHGETARAYLASRGLTDATQHWQVGYALDDWTALSRQLRDRHSADTLIAAGLCQWSRRDHTSHTEGTLLDRFRGRIMFPYLDADGTPIGFTARILHAHSDRDPKYINTPAGHLFDKSTELLGYGQARDVHATTPGHVGPLILTEGPADAAAIDLATRHIPARARPLPVAACGTAVTAHHLARLADTFGERELIVSLDSDTAGRKALLRAETILGWWPGPVSAAIVTGGKDPAAILEASGPRAVWDAIGPARQPLITALIDAHLDTVHTRIRGGVRTDEQFQRHLDDPRNQLAAARAVAPMLWELAVAEGLPVAYGQMRRIESQYRIPADMLLHVAGGEASAAPGTDTPESTLAGRIAARSSRSTRQRPPLRLAAPPPAPRRGPRM